MSRDQPREPRFLYLRRVSDASPGPEPTPEQEELRQRLEQQLRELRVQDLLLESVASIINLSARRIGKEDERDLEQARIGIDAVRAVVDLLDPEPREQVREALSQVQMLYVRASQGEGDASPEGGDEPAVGRPEPPPTERPGPEPPPRLWTPGRD
jgi:hypothetical protein